jgi:hypothetical protein
VPGIRNILTRKPKRPRLAIAVILTAAVLFSAVAGLFIAGVHRLAVRAAAEQHREDVRLGGCTATRFGALTGQLTVTNSAAATATYTINIRFATTDGHKITTVAATVGFVQPGATEQATVRGVAATIPPAGAVACTVDSARRRPV